MEGFLDRITRADLAALAARHDRHSVSLFMPAHTSGREVQQDRVRLRKLLEHAADELRERGLRPGEIEALLAPGHATLDDASFWAHRARGIVLLFGTDWSARYRLRLDLPELAVICKRPYLKPLFPLVRELGYFYVLGLAQRDPALYRGTRFELTRLALASLPRSLQDALQLDTQPSPLRFEVPQPHRAGARPAALSGQSVGTSDENDPIARYFRVVDKALHELLRAERAPLLLAGVEYLLPIYREVNTYPHLVDAGVHGNPHGFSLEVLHDLAWKLLEPHFARAELEARARFEQLAGEQRAGRIKERALVRPDDAVTAASTGRIDTLFVAVDGQIWGPVHAGGTVGELHRESRPGDEELLDRAAVETFTHGGAVYAVPRVEVPGGGLVAAVLRY